MKAFIIRILSFLCFTSFCTMLLWHYFTHSNAVVHGPRNAKEMPNSLEDFAPQNLKDRNAAPRVRRIVKKIYIRRKNNGAASDKQNPANNNAAPSKQHNVQQKAAESNNAADGNQSNVKLNPANRKDAAASNPRKIEPNAPGSNIAAAGNVKPDPANMNNEAAGNPRDVQQKPAASKDAAASNPRNIRRKPPARINRRNAKQKTKKNAAGIRNAQEDPVNSNNAINPGDVQESLINRNNDRNPADVQQNPVNSNIAAEQNPHDVQANLNAEANNPQNVQESINEEEIIGILLANYTSKWKRHETNIEVFRSFLSSTFSGIDNATVTQENSPVGTKFTYDGDNKKSMVVTPELFKVFPKENPFQEAPWETCAVVGNGGILANSSCGKEIDSSTFVFRCNLPPLNNGHEKDTGLKTSLVTANPSIFVEKYSALNEFRRPFLEDMQIYGDAFVLLPAFSFRRNTAVCLRALYSLEDYSNNGPRPIIFNPTYLNSLAQFWREEGIHSLRLSTGIMMASLALELCNTVHLYGFWPFGTHPYTHQQLTNHYYDDRPVNTRMHTMPAEFKVLMNLHNKGVIHLHLDSCAK